jgi:hypothetical protein
LLATLLRSPIAQTNKQTRFERCLKKISVRFRESLGTTGFLKPLEVNVGAREFVKMIERKG